MTSSIYGPDPDFDPVGSRFNEAVILALDAKLLVLFAEQATAEFHTTPPSREPSHPALGKATATSAPALSLRTRKADTP
ncbi:hypothetical protein [Arthrobacter sp. KNU40]|uniref:hypothetical protein n=1 Tax=Arthrobacter sp. KNU40 TaxID=3447965 RepID=UPI003F5FBCE2